MAGDFDIIKSGIILLLANICSITQGAVIFTCPFTQATVYCNMTGLKTDAYSWLTASKDTVTYFNYVDSFYVYTKPTKVKSGSVATLATEPLGYQGRVCIKYDYAVWVKPMTTLTLYVYNPPDQKDTVNIFQRLSHAPPWRHVAKTAMLQCRDSFIGFVAQGDIYLDKVVVESGCCGTEGCPALWNGWSSWEECDRKCGKGKRYRQRSCDNPQNDECTGDDIETKPCVINVHCDAVWAMWSNWAVCDVSCGEGRKQRTRTCEGESDDPHCVGDTTEIEPCTAHCDAMKPQAMKTQACPPNCESCKEDPPFCDVVGCAESYNRNDKGLCEIAMKTQDGEMRANRTDDEVRGNRTACPPNCESCKEGPPFCDVVGCAESYSRTDKGLCEIESSPPSMFGVDMGSTGQLGTGLIVGLVLVALAVVAVCVALVAVVAVRRHRRKSAEGRAVRDQQERQVEMARMQTANDALMANREAAARAPKRKPKRPPPKAA